MSDQRSGVMGTSNVTTGMVIARELDVCHLAYQAATVILTHLVPKLLEETRHDAADRLIQACQTIPRLVDNGHGHHRQHQETQEALGEAIALTYDVAVDLCRGRELLSSSLDKRLCDELIEIYDEVGRQLFLLTEPWDRFTHHRRTTLPDDETGYVTDRRTTKGGINGYTGTRTST